MMECRKIVITAVITAVPLFGNNCNFGQRFTEERDIENKLERRKVFLDTQLEALVKSFQLQMEEPREYRPMPRPESKGYSPVSAALRTALGVSAVAATGGLLLPALGFTVGGVAAGSAAAAAQSARQCGSR